MPMCVECGEEDEAMFFEPDVGFLCVDCVEVEGDETQDLIEDSFYGN